MTFVSILRIVYSFILFMLNIFFGYVASKRARGGDADFKILIFYLILS
jgi:hypothetical protein